MCATPFFTTEASQQLEASEYVVRILPCGAVIYEEMCELTINIGEGSAGA